MGASGGGFCSAGADGSSDADDAVARKRACSRSLPLGSCLIHLGIGLVGLDWKDGPFMGSVIVMYTGGGEARAPWNALS